jgi:RNA polymerase sigma-70 factor, ECF subfamily
MRRLLALLSEDVTLSFDGGGKTRAALNPIRGREKVGRFLSGMLGKVPPGSVFRQARVKGHPGLVGYVGDGSSQSVATLEVMDGDMRAIRLVVNPEKLGSVPPLRRTERVEDPG